MDPSEPRVHEDDDFLMADAPPEPNVSFAEISGLSDTAPSNFDLNFWDDLPETFNSSPYSFFPDPTLAPDLYQQTSSNIDYATSERDQSVFSGNMAGSVYSNETRPSSVSGEPDFHFKSLTESRPELFPNGAEEHLLDTLDELPLQSQTGPRVVAEHLSAIRSILFGGESWTESDLIDLTNNLHVLVQHVDRSSKNEFVSNEPSLEILKGVRIAGDHIFAIRSTLLADTSWTQTELDDLRNTLQQLANDAETVRVTRRAVSLIQAGPNVNPSEGPSDPRLTSYCCLLCKARFSHIPSFQRHLESLHYPRRLFTCPDAGCNGSDPRRDKFRDHFLQIHSTRVTPAQLDQCKVDLPAPPHCQVCTSTVRNWPEFFKCFISHCVSTESENSPSDNHDSTLSSVPSLRGQRRIGQRRAESHRYKESQPMSLSQTITMSSMINDTMSSSGSSSVLHQETLAVKSSPSSRMNTISSFDLNLDKMKESRSSFSEPTDLSDKRPSQTPEQESPSQGSGNESRIGSTETLITEPDLDDNLPATISDELRDLDPVLNADAYYGKLDMIELRTAKICGLSQGPLNLENATMNELEEICVSCINAFEYMQSEGFCGEEISIMVEDGRLSDTAHTGRLSRDDIDWRPALSALISSPFPHMLEPQSILERSPLGGYIASLGIQLSPITLAKALCATIATGLLSFSGSHVCRFDTSVWGEEIDEIYVGSGLSFRRRELACLKDFIGGPIWVLGKSGQSMQPAHRLKISLLVQDLQDLWGPAWLVGRTPEEGKIIRTERGYIVPLPRDQQHTHSLGIECHWTEDPDGLPQSNDPILLNSTSRIVIGTDLDDAVGLVVNSKCSPEAAIQRFQPHVANSHSMAGTQPAFYSWEDQEFQIGFSSQHGPTANLTFIHKRHPMKSMKETIISQCMNNSWDDRKLSGVLKLQIGLEISVCTGNAQRRSLWDVLHLSHTEAGDPSNIKCGHEVGDFDCVRLCWTQLSKHRLCRDMARKTLIDAICMLRHTGINKQGNLEAHWPFVGVPTNHHILSTKCNRWLNVVRDTTVAATFAVMSQRCLEFLDRGQEGLCSKLTHSNNFLYRQTCLGIQACPYVRPPSKLQRLRAQCPPSFAPQICPFQDLLPGERFRLGDVSLKLNRKFEEHQAARLVYSCVSSLNLSLRTVRDFRELINPELKVGKPVRVVIHSDEPMGNGIT